MDNMHGSHGAPEPTMPADSTIPYLASEVPHAGRRASRSLRWAASLGLAVVLLGGGAIAGAVLAGGGQARAGHASLAGARGHGGAEWRSGVRLAASLGRPGQAALSAALGVPASAQVIAPWAIAGGASGLAGNGGHGAGALGGAGHRLRAAAFGWLRRCVASARHLRATGHLRAAHARVHACVRRFLRLRFRLRLRLRLLLLGGLHGQITFRTRAGIKTIAFERGVIQSVSGGAVTVRAADGTTMTWHLIGRTVIVSAGHRLGAAALAAGERVLAVGRVVSGADDARLILIRR